MSTPNTGSPCQLALRDSSATLGLAPDSQVRLGRKRRMYSCIVGIVVGAATVGVHARRKRMRSPYSEVPSRLCVQSRVVWENKITGAYRDRSYISGSPIHRVASPALDQHIR